MGENLALNFEGKGYAVAVYNRRSPGREHAVDRFVEGRGRGKRLVGTPFDPRTGRIGETASADSDDDPGRGARRRGDRTADALFGAGRRGDRRGQFRLSRYAETGRAGGKGRAVVRGMRRIGRRTGRFARSFAYAGRIGCGMAADQRAVSGHRGQARRRLAVLRVDRTGRIGSFRQNGPQRHRIRRPCS